MTIVLPLFLFLFFFGIKQMILLDVFFFSSFPPPLRSSHRVSTMESKRLVILSKGNRSTVPLGLASITFRSLGLQKLHLLE